MMAKIYIKMKQLDNNDNNNNNNNNKAKLYKDDKSHI